MKKLILISILSLVISFGYAQTVISKLTTIESVSNFAPGTYRFFNTGGDTVDVSSSTLLCPKVDTAAIQALKICPVCPPPVICPPCPVCPPQKPQRIAVAFSINKVGQVITTYNDGSTTTFALTTTIFIK